jgi:DUF4097 and DUF4098 domain-containing protein YvlB
MREGLRHGIVAALALAIPALAATGARSASALPAGEPLAVEATPLLPIETESSLSIVGIRGQIGIEAGDGRELRVISRETGEQGKELPIGIWQEGSKLILAPAPGDKGGARMLRVEVPRDFAISLDAVDSDASIASAGGGIELNGTNLRVAVHASAGFVSADLQGGSLTVTDSSDASVSAKGTAIDLGGMSGNVIVRAAGGRVKLRAIHGSTDVETDDCAVVVDDLTGSTRLKAQRGDVTATGINAVAEFALSGAPLHLKEGRGDITVTSDAPVDFLSMAAGMHLDMYGGSLKGKGNQGILEVRTRNTEVNVEGIDMGMRIQGDGLKAKIADVVGELYIETRISEVFVDRVASVTVSVDRGNVTIQRATGEVQATVTGGDVHIIDGTGPVTLELDRGDADVSWASLTGEKDSKLTNTSGNITVRFPVSGMCRIEAKSKYGRIDSDLPAVKVTDDLTEAQGSVNSGNRPIVNIVANGDIHLIDGSKSHDAE